jgi:hypothetical protein
MQSADFMNDHRMARFERACFTATPASFADRSRSSRITAARLDFNQFPLRSPMPQCLAES